MFMLLSPPLAQTVEFTALSGHVSQFEGKGKVIPVLN
jgi:hypothetical protein